MLGISPARVIVKLDAPPQGSEMLPETLAE